MNNSLFHCGRRTFLVICLFLPLTIWGQDPCDSDTHNPTPVCSSGLEMTADPEDGLLVHATMLDVGSSDNCGITDFRVVLEEESTGEPPAATNLILPPELGLYILELWMGDAAGNWDYCTTYIIITGLEDSDDCEADTTPPTPVCDTGLSTSADSEAGINIWAADLNAGSYDDCGAVTFRLTTLADDDGTPPATTSITLPPVVAEYPVRLWVGDESGNWSFCDTEVIITELDTEVSCDDDTISPVAICDEFVAVNTWVGNPVTVQAAEIDEGSYDDCSPVELTLELAANSEGVPPSSSSVTLPFENGLYDLLLWAVDEAGNANVCQTTVTVTQRIRVEGQLFADDNGNCAFDVEEEPIAVAGWTVRVSNLATGNVSLLTTQEDGSYLSPTHLWSATDPSDILVELLLPNGFPAPACGTEVVLSEVNGPTVTVNWALSDFPADCNYLYVDVGTPFLRRCFPNTHYVHYYNFSTVAAPDVVVFVQLDPFLTLASAELPYTDLGGGLYSFTVGELPAGQAGNFTIESLLSCEAELGKTHCVWASIKPFDCDLGGGPSWSGAELSIAGECDEGAETVRFTVTNVGPNPMDAPADYFVVEDVVMYMQGSIPELGVDESHELTFPANGATWRVALPQVPDHPFEEEVSAFVEGCGGLTTDMVNAFPLSEAAPDFSIDCQPNIGAWDPNDKQAFPRGYGEAHYIRANTDLEYLIRFQNTGTDTAFNVRIEDQLSPELDWSSIEAGAGSHPYRMSLNETGLLQFYFDDIMLPDSNVNEPASHGFVKFRIAQQADLPDGTVIDNRADIYFDFNEPILTNTVTHTVGSDYIITVGTEGPEVEGLQLTVAPNPARSSDVTFTISGYPVRRAELSLFDIHGRQAYRQEFAGQRCQLSRQLPRPGLYFYRITEAGKPLVAGRLLVH